jgi:arginine decarboxylase
MKYKYIDLISQTFDFPQEEFDVNDGKLTFHKVDLMKIIEEHGTPLKFTYLPKISNNINRAKKWFADAIRKLDYSGEYNYCYCTKSSHFSYVLERVLSEGVHLETSSAFDIDIIENLERKGKIDKKKKVICNGFKTEDYATKIAGLINSGYESVWPVIDNYKELDVIEQKAEKPFEVGIRIASEEEPKFEFYTSRLGIGYRNIVPFYKRKISENENVKLRMLHFFVNTGINDNAYYWSELQKCLRVYCELKKICPTLDSLNIGGGFPIKNSLAFDYDYAYMIEEIVNQIKLTCAEYDVPEPHIYTEFGSFTVGESGGNIYKVLYQKQQNDKEKWNMIDSSFMTTLPDTWAISRKFIMLPVNNWDESYERVFLGGLTCDSDDYYNSEQHVNAIFMPEFKETKTQYLGFFNTGAYQETIGGFGGIHHCLIPGPKHILIDREKDGKLTTKVFAETQRAEQMMDILGYQK